MNDRRRRWLDAELDAWLADGVIDAPQAVAIRARYPEGAGIAWGRVILSAIGAIVFGLGIILFFAYNWEAMPRLAKLATILAGLVAAHGGGWWLAQRGRSVASIEAAHLLGTMLFGAGIWLVAQAYHIDPIVPDALLAWGLGALAVAWPLRSVPQAVAALALVVAWGLDPSRWLFDSNLLGVGIVAAGIVPLGLALRSKLLTAASAAALLVLVPVGIFDDIQELVVLLLLSMAVVYIAVGTLARPFGRSELKPVAALGHLLFIALVFALTFQDVVRELARLTPEASLWLSWCLPVGVAVICVGSAWLGGPTSVLQRGLLMSAVALVGLTAIVLVGPLSSAEVWWVLVAFNLGLLAHGVVLILDGSRRQSWMSVSLGCLAISMLAMARFVDVFESLLMRSLAFLAIGAGLYAVGVYYQWAAYRSEKDHA